MPEHEECIVCNYLTERAGRSDDSLYLETPHGEIGPLCDECHNALRRDDLIDERDTLRAEVEWLREQRAEQTLHMDELVSVMKAAFQAITADEKIEAWQRVKRILFGEQGA